MVSFLKPFPLRGQIEPYAFRHPSYPEWAFWQIMSTATYTDLSEHQVAELIAANWQKAELFPIEMRLCAASQLALLLLTRQAEATIEETWINLDDLHSTEQYPVLLVFKTPLLLDEQETLRSLAHMTIGSEALIFQEETCFLYSIDQLGTDGIRLCFELQRGIDTFTFPEEDPEPTPSYPYERELQEASSQQEILYWSQTQRATRQLAQLYWQLHQQQKYAIPSTRSTPKAAAFQHQSVALIPSSLAVQGVLSAYSNAQSSEGRGWKQDEHKPMYLHQRAKDYAQVEWKPAEDSSCSPADLETLWKHIRAFNDHDGDVLLCLLAHWVAASKDSEGYTWITAEHLLSYRGIQPRTYMASDGTKHLQSYRQENLEAISTSIEHIRNTHVTVRQWTQVDQGTKRRGRPRKHVIQLESYLLSITDFLQQHTLLASHDPSPKHLAIAWRYRPGTCIEALLDQQLASLFQQALAYDPYREQWEKRLTRYFTFHLYSQGNTDTITRTLHEIIDELSLPITAGEQDKTRKRFEKAMKRLGEDHLIAGWNYVEAIADLPSQHWLSVWLSYHIQVVPVSPLLSSSKKRSRPLAPTKKMKGGD